MSSPIDEIHSPSEEILWVDFGKEEHDSKIVSKGISGILVPLGCAATAGVLLCGLREMLKKNSKKQQLFMRYRILAQGITFGIALAWSFKLFKTE